MNNANRREKLGIFDRNQACAIASITLSILCPSSDAAARWTWAHLTQVGHVTPNQKSGEWPCLRRSAGTVRGRFVLGGLFWNCELEPTPHHPKFQLTESVCSAYFKSISPIVRALIVTGRFRLGAPLTGISLYA